MPETAGREQIGRRVRVIKRRGWLRQRDGRVGVVGRVERGHYSGKDILFVWFGETEVRDPEDPVGHVGLFFEDEVEDA